MSSRLADQSRLAALGWVTTLACALSFGPLIVGFGYVVTAALVTAVPLLTGIGLRASRLPAWVVLVGQLAALVVWVTALYGDGAAFGFVPTPAAAESIRALAQAGLETAQTEPAPAPATAGLLFITTVGIAACHLLVDLFAATLHRVPLTGLPLLALYTVPAAIATDGVPTLAFLAAAIGFVLLLASDERSRLSHWGRQLTHGHTSLQAQRRITNNTLDAAAQRVGVLAIAVAAVVPLLLPSFPAGLLGNGTGDGSGSGGTVSVSNPIVDIRRELRELSDEPAMTVRTSGDAPEYFRLAVLDAFDGRRWQFSPRRLDTQYAVEELPGTPPGLDPGVPVRTQRFDVDVSARFRSEWLPAPYAPTEVRVAGDWRYSPETLDIIASDDDLDTAGISYQVTSLLTQPSGNDLAESTGAPARISDAFTDLPDDLPDEVGDLTDQITGTASRYEKAVAIQEWFRTPGRFEYTLDAPAGHSDSDLVTFLLEDRRGYCEQFAASMAVMARHAGIPSRVAVGFLRPNRIGENTYQYTYAAMHAWPELYFEGAGWLRFEPTPAARDGSIAPPYSTGEFVDDPQAPTSEPTESSAPTNAPDRSLRQLDPGAAAGSTDGGGPWGTATAVVVSLLVLASVVPGLLRLLLRRRRWSRAGDPRETAEAAWDEVRDTVIDLRHPWPQTTPRRTSALLRDRVAHRAVAVAALDRIALAVERARFARTPADWHDLHDDVDAVCAAMRERESRGDRLRARLLPRSLRVSHRRWAAERSLSSRTRGDDASVLPSAP